MVKQEQPPAPEQPMPEGMAPEQGQQLPPELAQAALAQAMPPMPEQMAPAEQVQQGFGGPGVPGATSGTVQL